MSPEPSQQAPEPGRPEGSDPGTVAVPIPINPPPGSWGTARVYLPNPVSPMMESLWFPLFEKGFAAAFAEFGVPLETNRVRSIGGWAYMTVIPLGGPRPGGPPPWWVMGVLSRVIPALRRRVKTCVEVTRTEYWNQVVDEWERASRAEFVARARRLRSIRLDALSDAQLVDHLEATRSLLADGTAAHFRLAMCARVIGRFALDAEELLGWDDAKTVAALGGLSPMTNAPARRLAEIRTLPEDARHDAIESYLGELGCRLTGGDVIDPTLGEVPGLIEQILDAQHRIDYDPAAVAERVTATRTAILSEARHALAARPGDLARFERSLAAAERIYPNREDNVNLAVLSPLAIARLALLDAGRRLVGRDAVDRADDVMFLTWEEMLTSLRGRVEHRHTVSRRRGERAWAYAHPGPESYGPAFAGPPDLRALPIEVRQLVAETDWTLTHLGHRSVELTAPAADAGSLPGLGTSPGVYEGPARVIRGEADFGKLEPGDVLVCETTTPSWSPLFSLIGALVTDIGALMTHPSIIAREFGIPAVVNTRRATSTLEDGQLVRVDGGRGIVEVI